MPIKWKPIGPGGSLFRGRRSDGRNVEVCWDTTGEWLAFVERQPSGNAGMVSENCVRVGAFRSRGSAQYHARTFPMPDE